MPEINATKVNSSIIKDVSLSHDIAATSAFEKRKVVFVEQSLKELSFKELTARQSISDNGYFCQISIKSIGPYGAGVEFLTGLTLGIIPTYTSECCWFDYEYQLFKDIRPIKKEAYKITGECFNWILVAPIAWGSYNNDDREQEVIKSMTRHLFSNIKM